MKCHDDVLLAAIIAEPEIEPPFTFDRRQLEIRSPISNYQRHNPLFPTGPLASKKTEVWASVIPLCPTVSSVVSAFDSSSHRSGNSNVGQIILCSPASSNHASLSLRLLIDHQVR